MNTSREGNKSVDEGYKQVKSQENRSIGDVTFGHENGRNSSDAYNPDKDYIADKTYAIDECCRVSQEPDNYCGVILAAGYSSRMKAFKPLLPVGDMTAIERSIAALEDAGIRKIIVVTGHNRERIIPLISAADMRIGCYHNVSGKTGYAKREKDIKKKAKSGYGVIEAYNENFADGMFSSIKTGLAAVRENFSDVAGVFLMPVDCPLISSSVIMSLAESARERAVKPDAAIPPDELGQPSISNAVYESKTNCADKVHAIAYTENAGTAAFFHVPIFNGKKGHPLMIPATYIDEICGYEGGGGLKAITDKYWNRMLRVPVNEEGCLLDMDTPEGYEEIKKFLAGGCRRAPLHELAKGRRIFLVRHGQTRQHKEKMFIGRYDVPLADDAQADIKAAAEKILYELETSFGADFEMSPEQCRLNDREASARDAKGQKLADATIAVPFEEKKKEPEATALHDGIAIYSSPLKRALQTAEIISDELKKSGTFNEEAAKMTGGIKIHVEKDLQEIALGKWDGRPVREIREQFPEEYERRGRDIFAFKTGNKSENFYDVQYRAVKALREILEHDTSENIVIVSHSAVIRSLENNLKGKHVDDEWEQLPKGGFRIINRLSKREELTDEKVLHTKHK